MKGSGKAEIVAWPSDPESQQRVLERAAALIRSGEIVAFPTDTVYGIGALAWDGEAVRRLYAIKERPAHKAIALLISDPSHLAGVSQFDMPSLRKLSRAFWPGGLTMVLPWRPGVRVAGEQPIDTVGVRVPDHPIALGLIAEVGEPLATTSANLSGSPSAVTAQEVAGQIGDRVALIVDGGACPGGRDSTVVDLTTEPPTVRRAGAISVAELEAVLGPVVVEGR